MYIYLCILCDSELTIDTVKQQNKDSCPMIYSYDKDLLTKHSIKCQDDLIIANVKLDLDMHKVKILKSIRLKDVMYHYNNHQPLSRCQQF